MTRFATYLHPETLLTSKPNELIRFTGYSWPYFSQVRLELEKVLGDYKSLSLQQVDLDEYGRVHTATYLRNLQQMAAEQQPAETPHLGIGCDGLQYCLPGYTYSLGGMFEAIDHMRQGVLERAYCFSLGGHHAFPDWGHGYCLLNPQAAAARYAQQQGFGKVLIVDWDLHHGDGTQAIFAHDKSVYCISIHSVADLYMAVSYDMRQATITGGQEVGQCNIPILADSFADDFFEQMNLSGHFYRGHESLDAFRSALANIPWLPDIIFIFAGYDGHMNDQGRGVMNWTNDDYRLLTQVVLDLAQKVACPVLSVHGGGYNLQVAVAAAKSHVEILAG